MLVAASVVFVLERLSGNPALLLAPVNATDADVRAIAKSLGLEDPLYVQYARFLTDLVQGNLGHSIRFDRPVTDILLQAAPYTLTLALGAFLHREEHDQEHSALGDAGGASRRTHPFRAQQ